MAILGGFSRVSSWFGRRKSPTSGASSYHKGIDLAAPLGTPVYAANEGIVTRKEYQKGYGNVVYIQHPDGTETRYGHLSQFANIQAGMPIQAGQPLGAVGSTGVSTGAHLHFEVRDSSGNALDPTLVYGPQLDKMRTMPNNGFFQNSQYLASVKQDQVISLTLATQEKKKEEEKNSFVKMFMPSLFKNNLLASLFKELAGGDEKTEKKAVALNLSIQDLQKKGFNSDEIQKLSQLAQSKQKDPNNALATLNQNGQCITTQEMENIGLGTDKIQVLNQLAQKNIA